LLATKNGQLWVGYFDRGLDILPDGALRARCTSKMTTFFLRETGFRLTSKVTPWKWLLRMAWVRFRSDWGNRKQVLGKADGLIAEHVTDVVFLPWWIGPLRRRRESRSSMADGARSMYSFHGLVNNHVYALAVSDDDLMVGTLGGLSAVSKKDS